MTTTANRSKMTSVSAEHGYTVEHRGTVTLRGTTFKVLSFRTVYGDAHGMPAETHLIGARGARYLLRPYIEQDGDTGLRQIISLGSGAEWRKHGNAVHVVEIGGHIEEIVR